MHVDFKPLLTIIIPVTKMAGKLTNLKNFLRTLDSSVTECILIHDIQDENTSSELHQIISTSGAESLILKEGYFGSPGYARNVGLEMARGEWIWFCDSDDVPIFNIVITELFTGSVEVDTYIFKFSMVNELNGIEHENNEELDVLSVAISPGLWRIVFRKSSIEKIRFKNFMLGEDQDFILHSISNWKSAKFVPKVAYKYHYGGQNHLVDRRDRIQDLEIVLKRTFAFITSSRGQGEQFSSYLAIRQLITIIKIGNLRNRLDTLGIFLGFLIKHPVKFLLVINNSPRVLMKVLKK